MKKLLLVLFGISALFVASKPLKVNAAEEVVSVGTSEVVSIEESVEQSVEESVVASEEEIVESEEQVSEYTIEEFKVDIENKLADYVDRSLLAKIITWLVDAGVLGALFVVYVKYRKHKAMTLEDVKNLTVKAVKEQLKEQFGELSKDEIKKITSKVGDLEQSIEVVMKVLVLMQDNTPKGKAALIEYLGSKTNSVEVKKASEEVEQTIKAQEQEKKEINDKVSGQYEDIF